MRRPLFYFIFIVIYALRGLLGAPDGTYVEITPGNLYDYFEPCTTEDSLTDMYGEYHGKTLRYGLKLKEQYKIDPESDKDTLEVKFEIITSAYTGPSDSISAAELPLPFVVEQLSGFVPNNQYPDGNTRTDKATARFPANPDSDDCVLSYGEEYSVYEGTDSLDLYSTRVRITSVNGYILLDKS